MSKFKEYRARKKAGLSAMEVMTMQKAGVALPDGVSCRLKAPPMHDEEKRAKKAERMREYRRKCKGAGATAGERARRYRQRKKFRKYCEDNSITCPPHVESIEGLMEWAARQRYVGPAK